MVNVVQEFLRIHTQWSWSAIRSVWQLPRAKRTYRQFFVVKWKNDSTRRVATLVCRSPGRLMFAFHDCQSQSGLTRPPRKIAWKLRVQPRTFPLPPISINPLHNVMKGRSSSSWTRCIGKDFLRTRRLQKRFWKQKTEIIIIPSPITLFPSLQSLRHTFKHTYEPHKRHHHYHQDLLSENFANWIER